MQYLYQKSAMVTSVNCQRIKAADIGSRDMYIAANRHEGLHYTDFTGQEDPPMDNVALFEGACVHKAL